MDGPSARQPEGTPAAGARLAALSDAATALVGLARPSHGSADASGMFARTQNVGDSLAGSLCGKKRVYYQHQAVSSQEWWSVHHLPSKRHEGCRGPQSRTTSLDSNPSHAFVSSSCEQSQHASDDERESAWGGSWPGSRAEPSAAFYAAGATAMLPPPSAYHRTPALAPQHYYRPRAPSGPMYRPAAPLAPNGSYWVEEDQLESRQKHDAQLLTSIAVFLAACGVAHSVRATQAQAPSDDDDDGAENPLSAARASARAEATFRASVRHVLQREVAYLAPLGRADFARLCQLLDLPLHVGATWQSRVLRLQAQLHLQPQGPCLAPADGGGDGGGECAANAMSAFCADLATERARSREGGDWHEPETKAKMRHFGRQTVWCTVALLRKVLEEASWPAGGRQLSSAQAEAKLASLAVAAIGGGCSAIEREATGQAADPATTCGGEGVSLV